MYEVIENMRTIMVDSGYITELPESINDCKDGIYAYVPENVEELPASANNVANFETESYNISVEVVVGNIYDDAVDASLNRKLELDRVCRDIKKTILSNMGMDELAANIVRFGSGFKNYTYQDCSYISTASITFQVESTYEVND